MRKSFLFDFKFLALFLVLNVLRRKYSSIYFYILFNAVFMIRNCLKPACKYTNFIHSVHTNRGFLFKVTL